MITGMDDYSMDIDDKLGSFDEGDPQTTNLYVGNLSPQVILHDHFLEWVNKEIFTKCF